MSHPNFIVFLKRFWSSLFVDGNRCIAQYRFLIVIALIIFAIPLVSILLFILIWFLFFKKFQPQTVLWLLKKTGRFEIVRNIINLLYLMENDSGSFFLQMEECLISHAGVNNTLSIADVTYTRMVLTPLIMDFGSRIKEFDRIHYNKKPVNKPVAEQTADVFTGIREYSQKSPYRFFEIYPFLGINPVNYSLEKLQEILVRYFNEYTGRREALHSAMGHFSGDVDTMGAHCYAGVKLYPPLGFDPWPNDSMEHAKVRYLYQFCSEKNIPLTVHCSDEGFDALNRDRMLVLTSPFKWECVLKEYGTLNLNIAHMGKLTGSTVWQEKIIELILNHENVYTDFSYLAIDDSYYRKLRAIIDAHDDRLKNKILFGSDFMMVLLKIESYCQYVNLFRDTKSLSPQEKHLFCSVNPQRFLFNQSR